MTEFTSCDFCEKPFITGTGHMCWCDECSEGHPMCHDCYLKGLEDGKIRKTPENRNVITESNLQKYK